MQGTNSIHSLEEWFTQNQDRLLSEFAHLLAFKSISTEAEFAEEMKACLEWLSNYLQKMNFTTERWETSSHPILFAAHKEAGEEAPTILIYNHYDVQPVDPLELWQSPPFEASIREGEIYARGAQDNKGQLFYVLCALQALLARDGKLPVNVLLCIEGEEEAGSAGLEEILERKKEELQADHFLVVDMGVHAMDRPAVTLGIRGNVHMTLTLEGSKSDLHSGLYGGVAYNPLHALVEMLASARSEDGSIAIPGFYDEVKENSPDELEKLDLEFSEEAYAAHNGYPPTGGEKQQLPLASAWLRPTLEINGIGGGYFGSGFKTVIPAQAVAKVSCRLVPDQDPDKILKLVEEFFKQKTPEGCSLRIECGSGGGPAVRSSMNDSGVLAATQAISEVFNQPCRYILSGGSIPVIAQMASVLDVNPILLGLGLPGDNMHAPNEHFSIERLRKGTAIIGRTLELFSKN